MRQVFIENLSCSRHCSMWQGQSGGQNKEGPVPKELIILIAGDRPCSRFFSKNCHSSIFDLTCSSKTLMFLSTKCGIEFPVSLIWAGFCNCLNL